MQNIIIEAPYRFVPPRHGKFWPWMMRFFIDAYLKQSFGVTEVRFLHLEKLSASIRGGHGILLTPNHSNPADPFVMGLLGREAGVPPYIMASWHLFRQNRFQTWLLPRLRVFSVYREGLDSASVREASRILARSHGPLVIFPEGHVTRSTDCLGELLEGTSFIARAAAKEKVKQNSRTQVLIHPVALRYTFGGEIEKAVKPVLDNIETRLSWRPRPDQAVETRIGRIGEALLALKELEYLGAVQSGSISERLLRLIDSILLPLEETWRIKRKLLDVPGRVRALRAAILPELIEGGLDEKERAHRWAHLSDLYLAQQLSLYPPEYLASKPTPDRIRETVERLEEDLTDKAQVYSPLRVTVTIGDAIPVSTEKDSKTISMMDRVRSQIEEMLELPKRAENIS